MYQNNSIKTIHKTEPNKNSSGRIFLKYNKMAVTMAYTFTITNKVLISDCLIKWYRSACSTAVF